MFSNLSFPKEPVMWMALLAALLNVGISMIQGDLVLSDGIESIVAIILGFVARSKVSPV